MSKIPTTPTKDTIYIDVDDEITAIIDKVNASPHKIVALVLPKRATMLQSIVNMKLLKRATDSADKHLVLVTSEKGLLPLAGAVGLHVAATPQSKPAVPHKPEGMDDEEEDFDEPYDEEVFNPLQNATKPIGELAGAGTLGALAEEETIQLDNDDTAKVVATPPTKKAKAKKDKKLKVPNFNSFRTRLVVGAIALVVFVILFVLANVVLPKSKITITTDSKDISSSFDVIFDKTATAVNLDDSVVPSVVEQSPKTATETAAASGQVNNGEKAHGQVALSLNDCSQFIVTVPSGTTISSSDGQGFVTQQSATLVSTTKAGKCRNDSDATASVEVVAVKAGASYNIGPSNFTVSGRSYVTGKSSSSMSGGTDNIVKILAQSDIDSAKQKLAAQTDDAVKTELSDKLKASNLYVVTDSFNTGTPDITVSAKAGDAVDSVTVTQRTTYSLVGAKQADIEELIKHSVADKIDTQKQKVLKTGLDTAVFKLQNQQDNSAKVQMSLSTTVLAGPKLDDQNIKSQVAGKKSNETKTVIQSYPGVTDVKVEYSPFWVSSNPKNSKKITISYEK